MKSYNHLMEQYLSDENYYFAVHDVARRKGKKKHHYRNAKIVKNNIEILKPYFMNEARDFRNDKHVPKIIYDGIRKKQRTILIPTIREQVIHHMIVNVLKPIFMKGMYEHSYGSIPERGAHLAKKRIEKWIKYGGKDVKYVLKMDVRKYFDSIPHNILKQKLTAIIHDQTFLTILLEIIDVTNTDCGIPLGFYTSQWFANWYLTGLDHYIKEKLCAKYYARYMDDMVIFDGNKRKLHDMRDKISSYLENQLGLSMKDNWQVYLFDYIKTDGSRIGRDLDFMGFRFYRDRTVLRKTIMYKATRKANRISKKSHATIYDCRQMLSYLGWLDCTDTYQMYIEYIKPYIQFGHLKKRISNYQKIVNKEERECGTKMETAT